MSSTLSRFVLHGIGLDPLARRDLGVMACKKCPEASGAEKDLEAARMWAMRHAGRTGHTEFRSTTTNDYIVKRLEGGLAPLT